MTEGVIPGVPIEMVPIDDLIQHPENPRTHADPLIVESIKATGFYGAVVRQKSTGYLLVGNGRTLAAKACGLTELPTQTLDLDDSSARRLLLRDNRISDLGGYDEKALADLLSELKVEAAGLEATGYTADDLLALKVNSGSGEAEDDFEKYTRKLNPIQYEPTGDCPPVEALVNRYKTDELLKRILHADLPEDVRDFLNSAAQRHLVFDYAKIAEFYAHADPGLQSLMEESALVIIDMDDAIRNGYVRLSARLAKLLDEELQEGGTRPVTVEPTVDPEEISL